MDKVLIVFLSATSAGRVKSILERKYAIPSKIIQTPTGVSASGCSYSLEIREKHLHTAWNLVKDMDLSSKGVFRAGSLEKVI